MPETISPGQEEQGAVEPTGALTSKELLDSARIGLNNQERSEMPTDIDELKKAIESINEQLIDARLIEDKQAISRLEFDLLAHETQLADRLDIEAIDKEHNL